MLSAILLKDGNTEFIIGSEHFENIKEAIEKAEKFSGIYIVNFINRKSYISKYSR